MISQRIKESLLIEQADKINLVGEYKQYLLDNGFSLSFDFTKLVEELKTRLFTQLLKADKSIAVRFGMLKTDKAKSDFINDKINLAGYEEVETLRSFITRIGGGIIGKNYELNHEYSINLSELLAVDMDVNKAIDKQVITWKGIDTYKQMQACAEALNSAFEIFRKYVSEDYQTVQYFFHTLWSNDEFRFDFENEKIVVNEMSVYRYEDKEAYLREINKTK
jgi:hypothetical protein